MSNTTWWHCEWNFENGFDVISRAAPFPLFDVRYTSRGITHVAGRVQAKERPTLAEFAAAVKDATGVEIPVPEEPQWHYFNPYGWQELNPSRRYVFFDEFDNSGQVWGTTADRDEKRDALIEAARKAGQS